MSDDEVKAVPPRIKDALNNQTIRNVILLLGTMLTAFSAVAVTSWSVSREVSGMEARVAWLEKEAAQGDRFTKKDGDELRRMIKSVAATNAAEHERIFKWQDNAPPDLFEAKINADLSAIQIQLGELNKLVREMLPLIASNTARIDMMQQSGAKTP